MLGIRTVLAVVAVTSVLDAQTSPASSDRAAHAAAFRLADDRSQELLRLVRCAGYIGSLRASGRFGRPDSVGTSGHCPIVGGQQVGVFLDTDGSGDRITRIAAIALTSGQPFTGRLDTVGLLAGRRAWSDAIDRGYKPFEDADRQFAPWTVWRFGDTLAVWLVPVDVLRGTALGGERGFFYSPDGRTMIREVNAFAAFRPFQRPDTGTVTIQSAEPHLPLMSELFIANALNGTRRAVRILTTNYASDLATSGAVGVWFHVPRERKP